MEELIMVYFRATKGKRPMIEGTVNKATGEGRLYNINNPYSWEYEFEAWRDFEDMKIALIDDMETGRLPNIICNLSNKSFSLSGYTVQVEL